MFFSGPAYDPPADGKDCYMNKYNNKNNITEAKTACNLDYGCEAVYESDCNEASSDVYLCPMGTIYGNHESSCIYKKGKNRY